MGQRNTTATRRGAKPTTRLASAAWPPYFQLHRTSFHIEIRSLCRCNNSANWCTAFLSATPSPNILDTSISRIVAIRSHRKPLVSAYSTIARILATLPTVHKLSILEKLDRSARYNRIDRNSINETHSLRGAWASLRGNVRWPDVNVRWDEATSIVVAIGKAD